MNSDGLGLGLTIVKQILEQNNGQIEVVSDGVGKGSCFLFSMQMDALTQGDTASPLTPMTPRRKDTFGSIPRKKDSFGLTTPMINPRRNDTFGPETTGELTTLLFDDSKLNQKLDKVEEYKGPS
jgi:hypothetical protein